MITGKDNLAERFIGQLDTLIAFLALAHDEVFRVVQSEYDSWVRPDEQGTLPNSSAIYRTQVSHAALILGFSYFEAFLSDVVRMIFLARPVVLPKEKKISYGDVISLNSGQDVVQFLIEKEVQEVMYLSYESIAKFFKSPLNLDWPDFAKLAEANALRNCIIHNMARADARLAKAASRWTVGQEIALLPADVHDFGLGARRFARDLWPQVERQLTGFSPGDRSS